MAPFDGHTHTTFTDESWARCVKFLDILEQRIKSGSSSSSKDTPTTIASRVEKLWRAAEEMAPSHYGLTPREVVSRVLFSITVGRVPIQFEGYLRQCPVEIQKMVEELLANPVYLSRR